MQGDQIMSREPKLIPEDGRELVALGRGYLDNGAYKLARLVFAGLVALEPSALHLVFLGICEERLERRASAHACFEEAVRVSPADPYARLNLGESHLQNGRVAQAQVHLRVARIESSAHGLSSLARKAAILLQRTEPCRG